MYKVGDYVIINSYDCSQSIGLILPDGKVEVKRGKEKYITTIDKLSGNSYSKIGEVIKDNELYSSYTHKSSTKKDLINIFENTDIDFY